MLLLPETLASYQTDMRGALDEGRYDAASDLAVRISSTRIAKVLLEAPPDAVVPVLTALPPDRSGRVLAQMPSEFAARFLIALGPDLAGPFFSHVPPDRAADILDALGAEPAEALLARTEPRLRDRLTSLRRYPPGSAGGVMTPSYFAIGTGRTVQETVEALRAAPKDVERASYVYVVDEGGKPVGVVSVKDLLRADPARPLAEVMFPDVVAVHVDDDATDAATLLRMRRFTLLPVLDADDRLVGVVTFDDAMDVMAEQVADQFAGVGAGSTEESFFTPPMGAVKRRLPWMAANVFLNLGAVAGSPASRTPSPRWRS